MVEFYEEQIGRRILQRNRDLLEKVRNMVTEGDYGKALTGAYLGRTVATLYKDRETRKAFGGLILHIGELIEEDFDNYARQNGIIVTEENKQSLMMEYSPHLNRCEVMSSQVIQLMDTIDDHLNN